MYWAVDEILEWAMFPHYQRCVADGASNVAIEELHAAAKQIGIEDSEESRKNRHDFALHLAGKSEKRWAKEELISGKKKAFRNIYLLTVDYQRWLCEERGFLPIVADEFRRLMISAIDRMDCPFNRLLFGVGRRDIEPYVAGKLGFMSLDQIHAPATLVAMKHFFDFLKEVELTKPGDWQKSQSACDALWNELIRILGDNWRSYQFLEPYIPERTEP